MVRREEHPTHQWTGGLLAEVVVWTHLQYGTAEGGGGSWSRSARSWAKLRTADHRTHQWRGDALEEARKAFLACDGHQRVKGGPVSSVWRRVLEPVFHLIQQMVMVALGQSELKQIEKGAKEGTKKGRTYRCQMEIRRRDPRCLQRCQRENRPLGQVCALGRRRRRYISHSALEINLAAHHFHRLASPKSTSSGWTRWATPAHWLLRSAWRHFPVGSSAVFPHLGVH